MKNILLIFYKNGNNFKDLNINLSEKPFKCIFVKVEEFKSQGSIFSRFIRNELKSIHLFKILSKRRLVKKLIRKLKSLFENNPYNNDILKRKISGNVEFKKIFEYLEPSDFNFADKEAVKLYNKVRNSVYVEKNFKINGQNLYEINRLEFVKNYYHLLLFIYAVRNLINRLIPSKVFIAKDLGFENILIIKALFRNISVSFELIEPISSRSFFSKRLVNGKFILMLEFMWFWGIWKIINRKSIKLQYLKRIRKKNLILAHYQNFYPSMIQVLKKFENQADEIQNILIVPHKLITHSQISNKIKSLRNSWVLPYFDINYNNYKANYKALAKKVVSSIQRNSLKTSSIDSIIFEKLIKYSFIKMWPQLTISLRYLEFYSYIFEKLKPSVITMLSGNDPIDVLATRIAKNRKIPTIFFQHAIIADTHDYYALEQDYVICSGDIQKEFFLKLGVNREQLRVFGIPLHDELFRKFQDLNNINQIKAKICQKYEINIDDNIILLLTTHYENFIRERIFTTLLPLIEKFKECRFIVKIHPIEDISFYRELAKKYHIEDLLILKEIDLHEIVLSSDVIIGRSTGAQIEAVLLNKPVIDLNFEGVSDYFLLEKFKAVLRVRNISELISAVQKILYDEETRKALQIGRDNYISNCLNKFDGKASKRIKNLIEKVVDN